MNKPILFFLLFLFVHSAGCFAQAAMSPHWMYDNHYLTDKTVINPAFTGRQYRTKIFACTQRMAMGVREAPAVHLAGAHGRLNFGRERLNKLSAGYRDIRHAVGGLVFADINGPFQTVGVKLDYAYIVPLNKQRSTLAFGLGGMIFSKRLNLDNAHALDPSDPLIAACTGNQTMAPDVNAGVLFSHDRLYVGLSVSQLLENSFHLSSLNYNPPQVYRNFYLAAGYRLVYSRFELEPSIAAGHNLDTRTAGNNGKYVDVNFEFYLKPAVFTLSYRVDGYLTSSFQYRLEHLELGIRIDLFSTSSSDARLSGIGVMAAYTF